MEQNGSSTGEYLLREFLRTESRSRKKMVLHCGRYISSTMKNNTLLDIPEIILQDEEIQVCLE